ncbi:MAG TPA: DUF885 domain-containing protein [Jatrophihabitans sp.]|nr:DUF885 domain-containing protein [Jatrophihabitans sp.]
MSSAAPAEGTARFVEAARAAIASFCASHPEHATVLGNHDHDGRLADPSPAAADRRRAELTGLLSHLDSIGELAVAEQVDREVLRDHARAELLLLDELDEPSWDPLHHNPGNALYSLISQDFAPLPDRMRSVARRLDGIPGFFDAARVRLTDPCPVHIETALAQLDGTTALIRTEIPPLAASAGVGLQRQAERAAAAVSEFQDWLRARLPAAAHPARLGRELYARKLAFSLATPWQPEALLAQAYDDLARVEAELAELVGGGPAEIAAQFAELARDAPDSSTILAACRQALAETTRFVAEHDLVTLLRDPVEVQEMPEIDRGIAVAYCQPVGPLERAPLRTRFAVSPTPKDWPAGRVASFYREYNMHMLHNLTVHEAMPGHVEQLSHARRYDGRTQVRGVFSSGSFIEGWAVYAEELMVQHGYRGEVSADAARGVRMQQLKMQLRMIINTILDVEFHAGDLDEARAMQLMTARGYQEEGEAVGKWRRVQLTSTQLSTYYVGYLEVRQLAADLRAAHPDWSERRLHDTMLGQSNAPVRHLRTIFGLPAAQ